MLHGFNAEDGTKYRFMIDDTKEKIRLFKRVHDEIILLQVWSYKELVNEMLSKEE